MWGFGGSLTLTTRNLEKLIVANGPGPVDLASGMTLGPCETYSATFKCAGVAASGAANGEEVEGTVTVFKFGHWTSRGTNNCQMVDGVIVHPGVGE